MTNRESTQRHPRIRVRILAESVIALGPGKADLLDAIAREGSISGAGRAMGMSYRRAWLLVDTMNRCFATSVVAAETGGTRGGGARLTPLGSDVVRRYRAAEAKAAEGAAADLAALVALLAD